MTAAIDVGYLLKLAWITALLAGSLLLSSSCQQTQLQPQTQSPTKAELATPTSLLLNTPPSGATIATTEAPATVLPTLTPSLTPDLVANLVANSTLANLPTDVAATATSRATRQPELTPTLSADDPAFIGTSIDELTARAYGLGEFTFTETITRNAEFHQYTFEYLSDDQIVEGFLTLPAGTGEFGEKFPVLLLLHGYIPPDEYELFPYSTRYVMPFVEAGYIVIHPSYRGHPPQPGSNEKNIFRIEYAVDVLNLIALVRDGSEDPAGPFRRADKNNLFLWGHSMGGGITQRVITVRPDWVSAAALYASMSGDEARNYERIRKWGDERTWQAEYFAPQEVIEQVSPIYFLDRWKAPITIHHGDIDPIVPPEWSRELCEQLKARRHPVECHEYFNYRHNLYGSAEDVFTARIISFFELYKK
ncbi:MAG: alpha/beta hydrolase family protein [Anaerolineae bacterium]